MSWISLDDGILEHPKFIRAVKLGGSEAIHLWLGLRAYCARHLTDGFIPEDMLDEVRGPVLKARKRALDALIAVGLVDPADGGVALHDYLDWSRSRDDVVSKRDAARARQAKSRATRADKTQARSTSSQRDASVTTTSVTPEPTSLSQRDSRVTHTSVTEPSPYLSDPYLTKTPPKPPEPACPTAAEVPCPPDLSLSSDALGNLAMAGIPEDLARMVTAELRAAWVGSDRRKTPQGWVDYLRASVTRSLSSAEKRAEVRGRLASGQPSGNPGEFDWQAQKAAEKAAEAAHKARVAEAEAETLERIRRLDAAKRARAEAAS